MIEYAELFAGVGGFRLGIEQSGLDASCAYASEWDKHACAVYRHIWRGKNELHEGDVREQDTRQVPDFDFLTAGFPCQSFSVAGGMAGFEDTRGTLFFEVARFLVNKRPRHFLLENVKNLVGHDQGKTFQTILRVLADVGYRVEWQVLNSTCWVPQNRERVFFIGHLGGECERTVFPLREDDNLYPEPSKQGNVANYLDSNYWKGWLDHGQRTFVVQKTAGQTVTVHDNMTGCLQAGRDNVRDKTPNILVIQAGHRTKGSPRIYSNEVPAMTQDYGTGGQNVPIVTVKVPGGGFSDNRVCSGEEAPTLMSCAKGDDGHQSGISHRNPIIAVAYHQNKSGTVTPHSESQALRSGASHSYQDVAFDLNHGYRRFRRLTPAECERLQGWPDDHTALGLYLDKRGDYVLRPISDTQRYRQAGNGVTADVIREIVKKMMLVGCLA